MRSISLVATPPMVSMLSLIHIFRGDHYVTLVVQVPERMNQAQKEALRRFDDAMNGITPSEEEKPKKKGIFK